MALTPQKRRVDGSIAADLLCPGPPLLKEQLELGPAATYGRADERGLALLGNGDECVAWRPRGDGGGAHRVLKLGLDLAADERPLLITLGTATRVERVAAIHESACAVHSIDSAPGTPPLLYELEGRATAACAVGRTLVVGDARGALHSLDQNGFASLGGPEEQLKAAQLSMQAARGAERGLVRKSLGALGGFASSVVGMLGDDDDDVTVEGGVACVASSENSDLFAFLATGACQRWSLEGAPAFVCAHEASFADAQGFFSAFSPQPNREAKKPWVTQAAACVGDDRLVAAHHAGEACRIVISTYADHGEQRRPAFATQVTLDSLDTTGPPSIIAGAGGAWACWRPRGADEWRVAAVEGTSIAALPLSCVAFGAPFAAETNDAQLRARRALLGSSGLAALVSDGSVLGVAADAAPVVASTRKVGRPAVDWARLVGALEPDGEGDAGVAALEALGAAARAYDMPSEELGAAAVDASTTLLGTTPLHGFGSDNDAGSATLALRFVEQRERRHSNLVEALAGAARCLDAESGARVADAHGRAACAAAAARVHAKLLLRKHRAGQSLSQACADEVAADPPFDEKRRAAGLGAVDALYGEAPHDSLRAARRSLSSCEDASSIRDVCALIRAAVVAGRDARKDAAVRLRLPPSDAPWGARDARESLRSALEALERDGFPRCDAKAPPQELRRLALDLSDLLLGDRAPLSREARDDATLSATCLVAAADASLTGRRGGAPTQRAAQWASDAAPALAIAEACGAHAVFLDACLRADDIATGVEDSTVPGVASGRSGAAGRARVTRRCAASQDFAAEALSILARRGLFGDFADLSHVCDAQSMMGDGPHGLGWVCAADPSQAADELVALATTSPSAACGTTLTSIASICAVAAGDGTRYDRCQGLLRARALAARVEHDDAPCQDVVRAALAKLSESTGPDRLNLLETALDALNVSGAPRAAAAPVWAAAFAADEATWRGALGTSALVVPPDCKRTCFYDLAAKRAGGADGARADPAALAAALAPRADAREIARLLASAQEDAREGARADRAAAAAARGEDLAE